MQPHTSKYPRAAAGETLVTVNESASEGSVEVTATGMLKTILDNTASTFTTVTIKCQVCCRLGLGHVWSCVHQR